MDYSVSYHPDVKDDIKSIPANMRLRIRKAIETRLLTDPVLAGHPLRQSLKGHRKLRVGDYRVIYRIEHGTVLVLKIGNRKDVYGGVFHRLK
jgi:mRNA interferase RelE/StbE